MLSERWQAFLEEGEQVGTLPLVGPDGTPREVEYTAKGNVLPVRHLLVLRDKNQAPTRTATPRPTSFRRGCRIMRCSCSTPTDRLPPGTPARNAFTGIQATRPPAVTCLSSIASDDSLRAKLDEELRRAAAEGHFGNEGWQVKKDGSRFWANVITMSLKDEDGVCRALPAWCAILATVTRETKSCGAAARVCGRCPAESTIAGIVSGEFDRIPEANDTFLDLVGYTREDLVAGRLVWPDLTPREYEALDELAHEEGLRFGACTPFEKELIRKDGTRVPVLVATAVLKLSPFRWITFVTDLRERDRQENIDEEVSHTEHQFEEIVGTSAALKRVMGQVEVVAPTDATVLILGETGTGKELIARAIHRLSPRRNLPFISLNCAAIPTGLLESELFGYERGAFTGALGTKDRPL